MAKKFVESLPLAGQTVLVRVDFNVPIKDGIISDDTRIQESLPTIQFLLSQKCKVILCSHLGRPKGSFQEKYSLEPVAKKLSEILHTKVSFAKDCVGDCPKKFSVQMKEGEILLLENLRFHSEEEKNDPRFASELASLANYFVQDAFGAVHRAHASTAQITKCLPSAIGILVKKEIESLEKVINNPQQPFIAILGGAKVSDKIDVIENLLKIVETIIIGGGMAYTFLKSKGFSIGNSLLDSEKIEFAKKVSGNETLVHLPCDHLISQNIEDGSKIVTTQDENIQDGWMGVDIGPKTILRIEKEIASAKTIFWNGPLGVFEIPEFSQGTIRVAKALAKATQRGAYSVVGGGDSIAAINASGIKNSISHVSTGGGASLEFIEGKSLPGLSAIPDA